jgi:nicotinamidase-related amidase
MQRDADAEGLVLIDTDALDTAQAAAAAALAQAARNAGIPVFDVRSADVALGRGAWSADDSSAAEFRLGVSSPALMPIAKMRRSAFADTRLGLLLRTNNVRRVTIAGADRIAGSLAATVFDALDADYAVTVATDASANPAGLGAVDTATSCDIAGRWQAREPSESADESRISVTVAPA